MSTPNRPARPSGAPGQGPAFIYHSTFEGLDGHFMYGVAPEAHEASAGLHYLPDEQTRDYCRRMHYAAYQLGLAQTPQELRLWKLRYLAWRDRIVLGNIKLVYRAVRRWQGSLRLFEDAVAECQVVLIQAVAGFNPWLGMRFSTYAYTCLVRALSRQTTRQAADGLARAISLEALAGEPLELADWGRQPGIVDWLDDYLQESHPLLSKREKLVLRRRFRTPDLAGEKTLAEVGHELGVSRERVRQLQVSGLLKLRKELVAKAPVAC